MHNIAVSSLRDTAHMEGSVKNEPKLSDTDINTPHARGQEIKDLALPGFTNHKFLFTGKFFIRQ